MTDKGKISDRVEVRGHLGAIRQALGRAQGGGIFLIGHYGAGKSLFLAYLERRLRI